MRKIGLIERTQPTRAALLLFGKKINHFFPSAFLKIGRFRSPTHIVDDLEIHDTLFEQVEGTMMWLRQKLETEFIISGKPQRDIRWEFPLGAIREALINAICHRDYSSLAHTQIRLYDDRLEIRNAGELPPTLTPEILFKDHDSMPRNSKIADAFFCAGLIEKWGSGTTRIVEELHAAKMPPPEFVSEMGRFLVRFHKEESLDKFLEKQNLSARQLKAVSYIKQHGKISNSKYRELLGVSKPTASKELQDLKIKGILGSTGTKGPGSSYHLKGSIGL